MCIGHPKRRCGRGYRSVNSVLARVSRGTLTPLIDAIMETQDRQGVADEPRMTREQATARWCMFAHEMSLDNSPVEVFLAYNDWMSGIPVPMVFAGLRRWERWNREHPTQLQLVLDEVSRWYTWFHFTLTVLDHSDEAEADLPGSVSVRPTACADEFGKSVEERSESDAEQEQAFEFDDASLMPEPVARHPPNAPAITLDILERSIQLGTPFSHEGPRSWPSVTWIDMCLLDLKDVERDWLQPHVVRRAGSRLAQFVGSFVWNSKSDKPAPHIRRSEGSRPPQMIQGSNPRSWAQEWARSLNTAGQNIVAWEVPPERARLSLFFWLLSRWAQLPEDHEFESVSTVSWDTWFRHLRFSEHHTSKRGIGTWFRMKFKDSRNPFQLLKHESVQAEERLGWHATSMYSFLRIAAQRSLDNGFAQNCDGKRVARGVFYMREARVHGCDNYMLYTMLDEDGWLYAPLVEIVARVAADDSRQTTLKRKLKQNITYGDCHRVNAMYIHMVHVTELARQPKDFFCSAEPGFHPALELGPHQSWQELEALSRCRSLGAHECC